MPLTNHHNAPWPLYLSIGRNMAKYSMGDADVSVTTLIDSPLKHILKLKYGPASGHDRIYEDVSDVMWRFFGTISHQILEEAAVGDVDKVVDEIQGMMGAEAIDPGVLEAIKDSIGGQRIETTIFAVINGLKVKGQFDLMSKGNSITDYKVTSVYTLKQDGRDEWPEQENLYVYLGKRSEDPAVRELFEGVETIKICGIARDWGPRHKHDMPSNIKMLEFPVWDDEKVEAFVMERTEVFKKALMDWQLHGTVPPICTDKERWISGGGFACQKPGAKRAAKLCGTNQEAEEWINANPGKATEVVQRPPVFKRCEDHCEFSKNGLCPYFTAA